MKLRTGVAICLLIGIVGVGAGYWWGDKATKNQIGLDSQTQTEEIRDLLKLYDLVEHKYVDPVDMTNVVEAGLAAMASSLNDPYSFTLNTTEKQRQEQLDAGQYQGIGLSFVDVEGFPTVIMSLPGSPAHEAGVLEGDRVIRVNGRVATELSKEAFRQQLTTPAGEMVELELLSQGETKTVNIESAEFRYNTVYYSNLEDGLAYLRITMFAPHTAYELEEMIQRMQQEQIAGLIIDLRGNSGGLFAGGQLLLDALMAEGIFYQKEVRDQAPEIIRASETAPLGDILVAVLVDRGTASMSEVVAAALQENQRAILIGEPTFGKGTIWESFELPSGTFVNLTVGRWLTPEGRDIHGAGLSPDITYPQPWQDQGELLELAVEAFNQEIKDNQ